MVDVMELTKYLLYLNRQEAEMDGDEAASDLTAMKLQKLLYYCQGYSLGLTGKPLFEDAIEAWSYGPVVRSVYKKYRDYKGGCLPLELAHGEVPPMDDYVKGIAKLVMQDKGKYSAPTLVRMTHSEPAWREAWEKDMAESGGANPFHDVSLSLETMKEYFSDILNEEMSPEEEERLWESVGRVPTSEEWREIALSL